MLLKNPESEVEHWLQERQALLIALNKINHLYPFEEDCLDTEKEIKQEFILLLTDYVSFGHMKIFEKMISTISKYSEIKNNISDNVLKSIANTTEKIIQFLDKKSNSKKKLAEITECLAERLEAEDVLINNYTLAKNTG